MTDLTERLARLSPEQRAILERLLNQENPSSPGARITAREKERDLLPLSFEQQRLWFMDQIAPGNSAYNSPLAVQFKGQFNVEALHRSLNEIVRRHEVLRTIFTVHDGLPIQVVCPAFDLLLPIHDLTYLPESERESSAYHLACKDAQQPFDLASGPVLRALLLRLSSEYHILVLTLHHITTDAWSMAIISRELAALYKVYLRGESSPLPQLSLQYADYALWQRQTLQGAPLEHLLSYWCQHLANLPTLHIPADRPYSSNLSYQGEKCSILLAPALKEALQAISRHEQATLFMAMLAAFKMLLVRYSGQEDIVVGTSVAGRSRKELEDLIGFFVNMLVLRTDLSGSPSFREALRRVREECLQAYAHQDLPFDRLVEELHPERDLTHTPLFQIVFQGIEGPEGDCTFPGLILEPFPISTETAKFDLLVTLHERDQGIVIEAEYSSALFNPETIERMLEHYRTFIEGVTAYPDRPLKDVPLLPLRERQIMLEIWNQTQSAYPDHLCLHELFEIQADRQPQAIALISDGQQLSYAQLNDRANQLAHYLRSLGVGPEVVVGLCVERSVEMVVGLLGILKAGGAYAPLDPTYPQERLAFMLAETSAPVVLTQERLLPDLPASRGQIVCLDAGWSRICQESKENLVSGVSPAHLAYIIFTSGSTGIPKGIAIPHGGVVNNIVDLNRRFAVGPSDSVLALSSLSFDMCVYEILGILEAGGKMILPPATTAKDPACWSDLLVRHHVTLWNSAPSLLELLVEHCEKARQAQPLHLRLALLGGDWVPVTLPDRLKALAPGIQFISLGGATEASIHSIIYPVDVSDPTWKSIPYGSPMANQQAYVLDTNLQPVPPGVPGELHLGGVGLARGYLARPDLTAEKFLPHPFGQSPGERLYKTGDLARYHTDGTIELLGRMDFLVKIHGLRIELGEIEAILKQHSLLQDAVVLVRGDKTGDKQLVAYVVARNKEAVPAIADLRAFLASRLPTYMQPKAFLFLERLPLSPNGKINRKGLPEIDHVSPLKRDIVSPRDALEIRLAEIWSAILDIEQIGIDEYFFELGGNSFKAIRAARACSETLALIDFFKRATIRELAAHLRQNSAGPGQLLYELTRPSAETKLTFVCIPYGGGNVISYQPLANDLPEGYQLYSVALPGHDFAVGNEPLVPLERVAHACAEEIVRTIKTPLALYGQCAGVALTIEIARLLEERNIPLQTVYLGAALPDRDPLRSREFEKDVSDEELLAWLQWLGGFEDIVDLEETRQILNAVRHDQFNAASYYRETALSQPIKLKTPICCVIGTDDAATADYEIRFQEWGYFGESVKLITLQGARHYFIKHQARELAMIITRSDLSR